MLVSAVRCQCHCVACVQIITQNQDRFVQMLNEPITEPLGPGAAGGTGGQMSGIGGGMSMPDEASYIHVTQEEKQAIDRVSFLPITTGFVFFFSCVIV